MDLIVGSASYSEDVGATQTLIEDQELAEKVMQIINLEESNNLNEATINNNDANSETKKHLSLEDIISTLRKQNFDLTSLSNEQILDLMSTKNVPIRNLEKFLGTSNAKRCVDIRRIYYKRQLKLLDNLESELVHNDNAKNPDNTHESRIDDITLTQNSDFDYENVVGACCENVIGCVRLPVGLVGPLQLDGKTLYVPMATTEGCLVASTSRGLSALAKSGGVVSRVHKNAMTRAPIVRFQDPDLHTAINTRNAALDWLEDSVNKEKMKQAFNSKSKHTNLINYSLHPMGREIHIRFEARTGDAMGMNMCSKGAEYALKELQRVFPSMDILTLSGNMCTDKKPSAINWCMGRGKSVECNAILSSDVVARVLKVNIDSLHQVWLKKVMEGSALAGSIGGYNCHAANIVAAIFIATGQDAAQVVSSSNCMLTMDKENNNLAVHCSMPSIECGTVGGGTILADQSNYLRLMGIKGPTRKLLSDEIQTQMPPDNIDADSNACKLSRIICATVMAAELSLLASLTEGTLVKSHMAHNRSTKPCNLL